MKLLFIVESWDPADPGDGLLVYETVKRLVGRGHRVTVATGWASGAGSGIDGVEVRRWPDVFAGYYRYLRGFSGWAREQVEGLGHDVSVSFSVLVAADVMYLLNGTIRGALERDVMWRRSGIGRLLQRVRTAVSPRRRAMMGMERRTFGDKRIKRFVVTGRSVGEELAGYYQIEPGLVEVIRPAFERVEETIPERERVRGMVRRGFGIGENDLVFLFYTGHPRRDGAGVLLRAFKRYLDGGGLGKLMLAGRLGYLQQHEAASLGVREEVRFVAATKRVGDLLRAGDVVVLPTAYAACSWLVVAALEAGVPVIASAGDGASELVGGLAGGGRAGRVVGTLVGEEELAGAMMELSDPGLRRGCSEAAKAAVGELSVGGRVERVEGVIKKVAEELSSKSERVVMAEIRGA